MNKFILVCILLCTLVSSVSPTFSQSEKVISVQNADTLVQVGQFGHGAITTSAWSNDGQMLAIGMSREIRIYSQKTSEPVIIPDQKMVRILIFRDDNQILASADDTGVVKLWDTATGQLINSRGEENVGRVFALSFIPDTSTIAINFFDLQALFIATPNDTGIHFWDYANSEDLHSIKTRETIGESTLALNSDSTRVVTTMNASQQRTGRRIAFIIMRDVQTGKAIYEVSEINTPFVQFLFSPTNPELLVSLNEVGVVRFWNANDGVELFALNSPDNPVHNVAFSPDGMLLATTGTDNIVRLWQVSDGALLETFDNQPASIQRLHINADGQIIAFSDPLNVAEVWDIQTQATISTFQINHVTPPLLGARFNPVTEQIVAVDADSTIHLWQPDLSEETIAISISIDDRNGVTISEDGNLIAVMNIATGQVQVLDIEQPATPTTYQFHPVHRIDGIGFSPSGGQLLISTFGDGSPLIANPSKQRLTGLTQLLNLNSKKVDNKAIFLEGNINAFAYSPVEPFVIYSTYGHQLWRQDLHTGTAVVLYEEERWYPETITFSPDGSLLAVTDSSSIYIWNTKTWTLVQKLLWLSGGRANSQLTFSPDGSLLIFTAGKFLQIYAVASGELLNEFNAHVDTISSVSFNSTGSLLMISSLDGTISLWGLP